MTAERETPAALKRRMKKYTVTAREYLRTITQIIGLHTGTTWRKQPNPELSADDWAQIARNARIAEEHCRAIKTVALKMCKSAP